MIYRTWQLGSWDPGKYEEINRHMQRYARQLQKEKAQAYIIGFAPRVVTKEFNNRSYGALPEAAG